MSSRPAATFVESHDVPISSSGADVDLQFATSIDSPIFLFFDPASTSSSNQELPFRVFESALAEGAAGASGDAGSNAQFVQLEYGVETGEAERIAVDGVTRGGMEGDGESAGVSCGSVAGVELTSSGLEPHDTTQRHQDVVGSDRCRRAVHRRRGG